MVSSSGDGVWPTRGAEASGLKCGRKRAADRREKMERGGVGDKTHTGEVQAGRQAGMSRRAERRLKSSKTDTQRHVNSHSFQT